MRGFLSGYPHFIDTIHGFVNRFLALPWLTSNGYPSPTIDNDVTTAFRRGVLSNRDYWAVQKFLEKKYTGFDRLRVCARDLSFDLGGKAFPAGPGTNTFKLARHAVESAAQAGYFCYDEMFVWARALLEDFPAVASWLRLRFPFAILDEMQDTFELQGSMLHAIFPRSSPDIVVQRVGDPNQAIFDDPDAEPNKIDLFPDQDTTRCLGIPNSYRFGRQIAALASPFAVAPVGPTGLSGIGPKAIEGASDTCAPAIFVFPSDNTTGVLDAYGKYVLTIFDDRALADGVVTAVGAVHQDASDVAPGHAHFPKSVPHYWSGYAAEICRKEPHPKSLLQYVHAARAAVREGLDFSPGIERIASGLIRLAARIGDAGKLKHNTRTHRAIVEALAANADALAAYRRLIKVLLVDWMPLTEATWSAVRGDILVITCTLCDGAPDQSKAGSFLAWLADSQSQALGPATSPSDAGPNVYRVLEGNRRLDIRLGSIHSVKGQTHLATMVLNTYWHAHSSQRMLPWLLGTMSNENGAGVQDRKRLLQAYVAMTRPSHLICLAIPSFALGDELAAAQNIATLIERGWRVAEIDNGVARWRS
jgi:hypothetical protein